MEERREKKSAVVPLTLALGGGCLLLLIVIVAVTVLFAMPVVSMRKHHALHALGRAQMEAVGQRVLVHIRTHDGALPGSLEELEGGAVSDPWGRPIRFERDHDGGGWRLRCLGADGLPGGEDEDADIEWTPPPDTSGGHGG